MSHLFIKKTLLGFAGLLLVVSMLITPGTAGAAYVEGGKPAYSLALPNIGKAQAQTGTEVVVFGPRATWKFFDKGTVPGSDWTRTGFSDGSWGSGSATLGYGNGNESTVVSFGSSSSNKYTTTYFRKTFSITNAANISQMSINYIVDDGAVVFLNGREVHRVNMPSGSVSNSTLASSCTEHKNLVTIDKSALVEGANTLAVEIHQCSGSSSDIAFSLELKAVVGTQATQPTSAPVQPTATAQPTSAPVQPTATVQPTAIPTTQPTAPPAATLPATSGKSFYVTASGSSSGDGTTSRPWSLQHALSHPSALKPGDTIWLRAGTYRGRFTSTLKGTSSNPITVRAYPGERVTFDAANNSDRSITIGDSYYVNFWGFEFINSAIVRNKTDRPGSGDAVNMHSTTKSHHIKFINNVIHDVPAMGFAFWSSNSDSEIYGSVIFNNGGNNYEHGIYSQNQTGAKRIVDNMIFNNSGHGIHNYGSSNAYLNNFHLEGNTIFSNGSIGYVPSKGQYSIQQRNILVGGGRIAESPVITSNYTYYSGTAGASLNLGYSAGSRNARVTITT
jgi:hypothetical protein